MLVRTYAPVFLMLAIAALVAALFFTLASVLGTKNPTAGKLQPFECGSESTGGKHVKISVKFYLTAILFILFDIEVIFLYPWALVYTDLLKAGPFIFIEMIVFMAILTFGLFYVWKGHGLDWD